MNRYPALAVLCALALFYGCERGKEKESGEAKAPEARSEPGTLTLTEEGEKAVGLKTQALGLGMAFDALPVTGSLDVERDRPLTTIPSPASGTLENVDANLGDAVAKGQPLARVSGQAVASPALGTVADIKARQGDAVRAGQPLLSLMDLSRLTAYLDVYEDQIPRVHAGQKVELSVTAYAGKPFYGTIERFSPQISPQTRAAVAQVDVGNAEGKLRPGMSVQARILLPSKKKHLVVPASAVLYDSSGASWVYVQAGVHLYYRRRVDLLPSPAGQPLVVRQGLKPGDPIVVQGAQELWGREFRGQVSVGEEGEKD